MKEEKEDKTEFFLTAKKTNKQTKKNQQAGQENAQYTK